MAKNEAGFGLMVGQKVKVTDNFGGSFTMVLVAVEDHGVQLRKDKAKRVNHVFMAWSSIRSIEYSTESEGEGGEKSAKKDKKAKKDKGEKKAKKGKGKKAEKKDDDDDDDDVDLDDDGDDD